MNKNKESYKDVSYDIQRVNNDDGACLRVFDRIDNEWCSLLNEMQLKIVVEGFSV